MNFDSKEYWENRYKSGGNSGIGSYGRYAGFKAKVVNDFIAANKIRSVIDMGCGDGAQLATFRVDKYIGLDVSVTIINKLKSEAMNGKEFHLMDKFVPVEKCDLALSLDVIYHLTEDVVYADYMKKLFSYANKFVIIQAIDTDDIITKSAHIKTRKFTAYIALNFKDWRLSRRIKNTVSADAYDFYIYEKIRNIPTKTVGI